MADLAIFALTIALAVAGLVALGLRRRYLAKHRQRGVALAADTYVRAELDSEVATAPVATAVAPRDPPRAVPADVADTDSLAHLDRIGAAVFVHREHILYVNPKAAALRGMRRRDLAGQSAVALFVPDDRGMATDLFHRRLAGEPTPEYYELRMLNRDGEGVEVRCADTVVEHDGAPALMTTAFDVSSFRRRAAVAGADGDRALRTLAGMPEAVLNTDDQGCLIYVNPAACALLGCEDDQGASVHGKRLADLVALVDETDRSPLPDPVERCLREQRPVSLGRSALLLTSDGLEHSIELGVTPLPVVGEAPRGAVVVLRDVAEMRGIARQMSYQASHDALTGLLNRREFEGRLDEALRTMPESAPGHVLCYLDLDRFKAVNDTSGHVAGDHLLRQLAALFREKVRDSDSVARLGGDEFGLLLSGCPLEKARQIADDVCNAVEAFRFVWRDKIFNVSVSIGLVEIGAHSGSVEDALSAADSACYVAKQRGRSRVHVYSSKDEALARHRGEIAWLHLLQNALKDDLFTLVAQPIVAAVSSERGGPACEVLLRLRDGHGHNVSPDVFGDSAQRYHLMPRIDRWVVRASLAAIQAGTLRLPPGRRCTLNLSGQTMGDPTFLEYVVDCLDETGVAGEQLCFEVTETAVITNMTHARRFIDVLHGLNCHFALDDFGSGMGSFANLKNLKMDYIKIDGMFTRNLGEDSVNQAMVAAMVKLARSLDIRVVAEQVETQSALDAVRGMGIDFVQGHVIGEPAPLRSGVN